MQCNQKCFAQPGQTLIDLATENYFKNNLQRLKLKYLEKNQQQIFEILKKANKLDHCHLIPGQEILLEYDNKRILQRDLLKSINISIPILYMWDREHIQGNIQICYDYLIFTVNSKKLSKEHKGKEDHLNFSIYVNEIFKIIFNPIAELMQIIIWGICGIVDIKKNYFLNLNIVQNVLEEVSTNDQ